MTLSEVIRMMRAAGCSAEQIAEVAEKADDERREKARAGNRERQTRYRERHSSNGNNAVTHVQNALPNDPPLACAFSIGEEVSILPPENATHSTPKGATKAKRATRLTENFTLTPRMFDFAVSNGLSEAEARRQGERMRDWSMSAKAGACFDWEARWRGWIGRFADQPRAGPIRSKISVQDAMKDLAREYENGHGIDLFGIEGDEIRAGPPRLLSQGRG